MSVGADSSVGMGADVGADSSVGANSKESVKLFAIADVHLSFGIKNKCMSIFKGWDNHAERLRQNWNAQVGENDFVVIGGDVSWGMSLEQSLNDFEFIDKQLNGNKILLKGNHDYWWVSISKMRKFLTDNAINSIDFLHNNAYKVGDFVICGTRGWVNDGKSDSKGNTPDKKILLREALRLERSIQSGLELADNNSQIIVFSHYPPIYGTCENEYILEILRRYEIKRVFSGHIHSSGIDKAFIGRKYNIDFDIVTADSIDFTPQSISINKS